MISHDFEERLLGFVEAVLLIGLIAIPLVLAIVGIYREASADAQCKQAGYTSGHVTWAGFGTAYCVTRKDQTDVVKPLLEVIK